MYLNFCCALILLSLVICMQCYKKIWFNIKSCISHLFVNKLQQRSIVWKQVSILRTANNSNNNRRRSKRTIDSVLLWRCFGNGAKNLVLYIRLIDIDDWTSMTHKLRSASARSVAHATSFSCNRFCYKTESFRVSTSLYKRRNVKEICGLRLGRPSRDFLVYNAGKRESFVSWHWHWWKAIGFYSRG